jgi:tRNA nucleotidyltransferase/poly(A) polymerase
MGTPSDDLDIVVRGVPYEQLFAIISKYGTAKDTSHEKEGGKDFGSTKFVSKNQELNNWLAQNGVAKTIDVMLPRKDAKDPNIKGHKGIKSDVNPMYTIQDDLERRDITINAIAMDLNGNLITNGPGLDDIENGTIRAVSEDAFIEDPLRMLRAVRFQARYNYEWDMGTVKLIQDNAFLLADKKELPKERFLMEFEKMIGKSDLGRAVKTLVDFGMYKPMFGVESKITDYTKFDRADNIGDFAFMMFEGEPWMDIRNLVAKNITNNNHTLSYVDALARYNEQLKSGEQLDIVERVNFLAMLNKMNRDVLFESSYITPEDREIANKFKSGELPANENDLALKKEDFKNFVVDLISQREGGFVPKRDGVKMGRAKAAALQAIYKGEIKNDASEIKEFLINSEEWVV